MCYNIFVSMPTRGRFKDDVWKDINKTYNNYVTSHKKIAKKDPVLLDTVHNNENERPVDRLSYANFVIFAPGWEKAEGCREEHRICERYGIRYAEI